MKSNRVIKVFSKNKILKKEFIRENKFSRKTEFLRKSVVKDPINRINTKDCDHSYDFGNGWLRQNY